MRPQAWRDYLGCAVPSVVGVDRSDLSTRTCDFRGKDPACQAYRICAGAGQLLAELRYIDFLDELILRIMFSLQHFLELSRVSSLS